MGNAEKENSPGAKEEGWVVRLGVHTAHERIKKGGRSVGEGL